MGILEDAKKLAEKATGIGRPTGRELATLVRQRKPTTFRFGDDGSGIRSIKRTCRDAIASGLAR